MDEQRVFPILLILVGFGGLVSASVSTGGSNVVVLATVFVTTISLGLIVTGSSWIFQQKVGAEVYTRVPASTLLLLGITSIIGSIILFHPWRATITQGLRVIITAGLVLFGSGLVFGGWRWGCEQQMRYPLGLLAGGFVLGVSYIIHQRLDLFVSNLRMVLIAIVAILITVAIPYLVPTHPLKPTGE